MGNGTLAQYLHQLALAEIEIRARSARIIREAEARGAKVTLIDDEIIIEETPCAEHSQSQGLP